PQTRLVAGYGPVMPAFQDQINEEGLMALIEYIRSKPQATVARQRTNMTTRVRAPFETTAPGLHALDNPWQESYVASSRG
ncbi:MAG: hypothetical protein ACREUP_12950, partial [Burkholderiales bacterium]